MEKYAIDYDLAGGRMPSGKDNPTEYTAATDTFTLIEPEKTDHDFAGWIGTDLMQPAKEVTIKEGSTGNREYAATWALKQFTVTFVDNGGTSVDEQIVPIHQKAQKPKAPTRKGYTFKGWYADKKLTKTFDFNTEITKDTIVYAKWKKNAASVSGTLIAKMTAKKKSITISWNKIQGAAGYDIFFARCNHDNKKIATKNVKTIKGNKTFKWTKSGLKKGTAYKAYVRAYVYKNGKKSYVRSSPLMHAYTGNGTKNYTNVKSVSVNKTKVTLKKGKTFKIKAKVKKVKKNKKLMPKSHAPTLRYMTSDSKIATVNSSGKITAKGKGTCYIYVFAHNGVSKQVRITTETTIRRNPSPL